MNTDLFEQLKIFIAEFSSVSEDRISAETRINGDLGIDGDDGEELLEAGGARLHRLLTVGPTSTNLCFWSSILESRMFPLASHITGDDRASRRITLCRVQVGASIIGGS